MYKIENTDYGIKVIVNGPIGIEEASEWFSEMKVALGKTKKGFSVFVDLRGFKPSSQEVQKYFVDIQKEFSINGMKKSVVVLDSSLAVLQIKRTAKESGIYEYERYVTSENNADWEKQAMNWILNNIDPDSD